MLIGGIVNDTDNRNLVDKMLNIYSWLSGYKFCDKITASKFTKLSTLPGMTNNKFIKIDYDLLFRKILLKE
jgi:tubulin polyglutamylase TTLL11